jgi:hypothetical protein
MDDDSAAELEEESVQIGDRSGVTEDAGSASNVVVTPAAEVAVPDGLGRNSALLSRRHASNPGSPEIASVSNAIDVPRRSGETKPTLEAARTQTPDGERVIHGEGPLTPRNDAGPFILDGSAGRASGRRVVAINEITDGMN